MLGEKKTEQHQGLGSKRLGYVLESLGKKMIKNNK
tara:strand:+ start:972 stop:1076 length:105 start_codon:yes stop_codon:yes gene_type:complete